VPLEPGAVGLRVVAAAELALTRDPVARGQDLLEQLGACARAETELRAGERAFERRAKRAVELVEVGRRDARALVEELRSVRAACEQAVEVADLRVERAGQTPSERAGRGQCGLDTGERRLAELRGERCEQLLLRVEVQVDRALGEARLVRNVLDRGPADAALPEAGVRGGEDRRAADRVGRGPGGNRDLLRMTV
jgi:hypothetical protein